MSDLETLKITIVKPTQEARTGMQLSDADNGTTFVEVLNESGLAFAAGVRVGDTVFAVNGVAVIDHEQGAGMVIAAEGEVELGIICGGRPQASAPADALGSGASLGSLGVDLASVLPQKGAPIDMSAVEEIEVPADLVRADGKNAYAMKCKFWCAATRTLPSSQLGAELHVARGLLRSCVLPPQRVRHPPGGQGPPRARANAGDAADAAHAIGSVVDRQHRRRRGRAGGRLLACGRQVHV